MSTYQFSQRHIGLAPDEVERMLETLGVESVDELIDEAVPGRILERRKLDLPDPLDEREVLDELGRLAGKNRQLTSLIGLGYYGTITPPVVLRNVLESPAWYTAYTPYQAEISQGRLEALLNFQTMVADLTGLDVANASLLDEGTAAAEAMAMARRITRRRGPFLIDSDCHPQTIAVVQTRAEALGIPIDVVDLEAAIGDLPADIVGALMQYPGSSGRLGDLSGVASAVRAAGAVAVAATDLLASVVLEPAGKLGADIVVGSAQRFGVPPAFGGPHAGFIAVREEHVRALPGRLVGVSTDPAGRTGYRLSLQTREQHIRRERATSNVCTAQVLLAVVAGLYAVWHGPDGLEEIARRVADQTARLAASLAHIEGVEVVNDSFFDTITVRCEADSVFSSAERAGINLRLVDSGHVGISLDETTTEDVITRVVELFGGSGVAEAGAAGLPEDRMRRSPFMEHPVFHSYRSEHEMLRYLRRLADRDLALDRTMIPLGSCTMKLNATTEMIPMTWPEFTDIHPFAPLDQAEGYLEMIHQLESYLAELTGYDSVSLQPNAGSQGELAGLLAIRAFHRSRNEAERVVCLIPQSAHGTNAASATMAGMDVVVVATDDQGNVDMADLEAKVETHGDRLAAAMVTYPSTHGVFEPGIDKLCEIVHAGGGQVYVDGANLNALVGLARPGDFGADIGHLNLHKTFTIPHGGGGPGVGPVGAKSHLAPFLPNHPLVPQAGPESGIGPISAAPWGSAGILPIPWVYIRLMGAAGLRSASEAAILSANYIATRLSGHYPVLYTGPGGRVAHECILDLRRLTRDTGITVEDVAKRLADYGFHAPTVAFPVAGTLMVEPTESEPLEEIERFCRAMISIRQEIGRVADGEWPRDDNPLVHAPHPAGDVVGEWTRAYPARLAAFPLAELERDKYWPPVGRIDAAGGDRNLMCSCPPLSHY
ncbi:MAG TPA: aminomethyl-transferring glycine dehydrogenase [Acidimicrobiia bacterium]|nr:aminomethyl-transferring glycine dehydrogenase [Acidimicrobiia bacterium]